ncbi:MAG: ferrochelatase [Rikenellaceae bacterium]
MNKQALLFINLGTPRSPKKSDVRQFLREFLMDGDVISLPFLGRWLLVNLFIVPFRANYSTKMYSKVWTAEGSPIAIISDKFRTKIQELHPNTAVEFAMRYPRKSLSNALNKFREQGITKITIVPLFPQRTRSNYDSSIKEAYRLSKGLDIVEIKPMYNNVDYIASEVALCKEIWNGEHIIFSFHSVPLKHNTSSGELKVNYEEQCYKSAELIAKELGAESYSVAFQSKMGRGEWLEPQLRDILSSGRHKEVMIVPAGFAADCLETLYELDIEMKGLFMESGGSVFKRVPALNDSPEWINSLKENL